MGEISLDEFKKLSNKEQCNRYKDLSNHDKYIFRVTDPSPFLNAKNIGHVEMTKEEKKESEKKKKAIIEAIRKKQGKISSNK